MNTMNSNSTGTENVQGISVDVYL